MKKMTDAEKARLKRLSAGKGALANGKLSMDQKLELNALKRMERQSRSYSPAPMSDAAKRKASRAGAEKARQYTDLPARRPSPNPARTSYSPQQMTEFDKRKAAARGKATAKKTAPKSLASKVVSRAKTVAREVRDIPTAVGTTAKAFTKTGSNPNQRYSAKKQSIRNLATQVREVGRAAAKGKSGTSSGKVVMGKETNRPTGVSKGKKRK